jgi:pSer/pThr/pTyr-binding forkhead associated (FHA) protein
VALAHARRRRFALRERPTVILVADEALPAGEIDVRARFTRGPTRAGTMEDRPIEQTMVRPLPPTPRAGLRVRQPGAPERSLLLDGASLTIGRAPDNDLVLADPRISRHHARISGRAGRLVLADLGSTNGTNVNGSRITEIVLGFGDQLALGTTRIEVVEVAAADEPAGPAIATPMAVEAAARDGSAGGWA